MMSPSFKVFVPFEIVFNELSIIKLSAPTTQGLPIPRATTAAWLVIPPLVVKIPTEECIPWMSSGLVSSLTKITSLPLLASSSALSASKTSSPTAAPGDAFKALLNSSFSWESTNCGCNRFVILFASTIVKASSFETTPSFCISIAIFTLAWAVLLAVLVWSR